MTKKNLPLTITILNFFSDRKILEKKQIYLHISGAVFQKKILSKKLIVSIGKTNFVKVITSDLLNFRP